MRGERIRYSAIAMTDLLEIFVYRAEKNMRASIPIVMPETRIERHAGLSGCCVGLSALDTIRFVECYCALIEIDFEIDTSLVV